MRLTWSWDSVMEKECSTVGITPPFCALTRVQLALSYKVCVAPSLMCVDPQIYPLIFPLLLSGQTGPHWASRL